MRAKLGFLLASFPLSLLAGADNNGRGTRAIALGSAFVAIADDPWAVCYNPAGLAQVPGFQGTVFFVPEQFGLKELRRSTAAAAIPFGFASAGIMLEQFGFELYRETTLAFGAGKTIDRGISVGATINVVRCSIQRYGSTTSSSIDVGALVHILDELCLGFGWKNVKSGIGGASDELLPEAQNLGVSFAFSPDSRISVEVEKDIRYPFILKAGIEQRFLSMLELRFGVSNNPDRFSVGLGAHYECFGFSYAGYSHPQLGWTHQLEVSFELLQ